jgi:DNA helicase-2/ATP-dependent DNA helicase PcrA
MITKEFEEAYKRLNKAQKEAVDAIEGPVMVAAGPGTGKTQILALRIANILKETDTPPSGILALTFTEAGQKAMKMRLRSLIGSRADEVNIYTYHGFAKAIIDEYSDHFPHLARAQQLSEVEEESSLRNILRQKKFAKLRPLGEPDLYLNEIVRSISNCRKEAWTPDIVRQDAEREIERLKNDPTSISSRGATKGKIKAVVEKQIQKLEKTILFAQVYEEYEEKKRTDRKTDFDDLIFELIEALDRDDLLLRLLQEKYLYILVDEHQDTNNSQNLLIKKLADFYEEPNLFVVGDEKQAVYRFQGASVNNFLEFQKIWPTMKIVSLTDNYRSGQNILDASFGMIENNYEVGEHTNLRIRLSSAGEVEPEPVVVVTAGNNEAGEEYLVKEIKNIIADESKTVAVIVRTNKEVMRILDVLRSEGISASAERSTNVFTHPVGGLLFRALEFLADESNLEALAYTVAGGLWGLSLDKSSKLLKGIRSGQDLDLGKEIPALLELKKNITKLGTIEFLTLTAELSGLVPLIADKPLAVEVWRSIIALASDIARSKDIEDPRFLISELLDYRQMAEKRNIKISVGVVDSPVIVTTAHGSKGLEYDYVFLPYVNEETWLSRGKGNYFVLPEAKVEGDEIRDARRLFYVALTRAKKQATIVTSLADALERSLTPLRFIDELDQLHISRVEIPRVEFNLASKKFISPVDVSNTEAWEYAKNILLEKGLSVTALNHFMKCPSEFFYKSILKLPEPPSPSSEKGNAMHEALSAVWALSEKTEELISKTIIDVVTDYFSRSLLSPLDKEIVVEELIEMAPKVSRSLLDHFRQSGEIYSEKWEETNFVGSFNGAEITLRLHGKLDVIVNQPKQTLVYDYKTKKKMSENEIRGETANGDGSYFRQLIFYKILLADSYLYRDKEIIPALIFVKPSDKGDCVVVSLPITGNDTERVRNEIQKLIDSVWSGRIMTDRCDDLKCEFCALRTMMG